jgi:tripartite-type tricarboxylate transporter receptor subunit TctC
MVPYSAGGPIDVVARGLAEKMSEYLKQPVLVDNRPGADEIIAASAVKGAPKDGYTLMLATEQSLVLNSFLHKKLPYDPEADFVPISRLAEGHTVLVVPSNSKANTLREFVELAKQEPGKINYAWSGVNRIPMGAFTQMTGTSVTYIGYKGGMAPIVQDLLAGHVDATLAAQIAVAQHISAGRIRGLAVSGKARSSILPGVPTFAEAGYPGYSASFYIGLVAPMGTPTSVVQKLAAACQSIVRDPAFVQKYLVPSGLEPIADAPEEFSAFLRAERPLAEKKVQAAGMKAE